jgi:hypothetical protein
VTRKTLPIPRDCDPAVTRHGSRSDKQSVTAAAQFDEVSTYFCLGRGFRNANQIELRGPVISPDVWRLRIGGYPVCDHWLKERRGRRLSLEELTQFGRVVAGCEGTLRLMSKIDQILTAQPLPFSE